MLNNTSNYIKDIMSAFNLTNKIDSPTRVNSTLLDPDPNKCITVRTSDKPLVSNEIRIAIRKRDRKRTITLNISSIALYNKLKISVIFRNLEIKLII